MNNAKKQYNMLLKSGLLLELYPEMSGEWIEDKQEFERIYEMEDFYTNNTELDDDGYEEF